jgi:hypothetical protein
MEYIKLGFGTFWIEGTLEAFSVSAPTLKWKKFKRPR